jgi:diaminopimelate epimerase
LASLTRWCTTSSSLRRSIVKTVHFAKYSGAGNDFLIIDNRSGAFPCDSVVQLCDRHEGVGADGVLLLEDSNQADYRMRILNADGSETAQCGNGLRCFMRYLHREIDGRSQLQVETGGGLVALAVEGDLIRASMPAVQVRQWDLMVQLPEQSLQTYHLLVGVPHLVHCGEATLAQEDLTQLGRRLRHHPQFAPEGANVNFAWRNGAGELEVHTYERGVEGLTQACGTGAVATACVVHRLQGLPSPITLRTRRGDLLQVALSDQGSHFEGIELIGPARFVFKGTYSLT